MLLETFCIASGGLALYHHLLYPRALKSLARRAPKALLLPLTGEAPSVTLIVPAYNEERFIAAKIRNCASLDYPDGKLAIVIVCDGCTDSTVFRAREILVALGEASKHIQLAERVENRGKIAVLNSEIAACTSELVALTDASALLPPDALWRAAEALAQDNAGFVTGTYAAPQGGAEVEAYWRRQTAIKQDEAALGAPFGAHGAFYAFPRKLWRPLEPDAINDDVLLPMAIVAEGQRGIYDAGLRIEEAEVEQSASDLRRRFRLGAGALQQAFRLRKLADPRRPGLAFVFLSGKALRAIMPFLLAGFFLASLALAGQSKFFALIAVGQIFALLLTAFSLMAPDLARRVPGLPTLAYGIAGYAAYGLGGLSYLLGYCRAPWRRVASPETDSEELLKGGAALGKRALDIVVSIAIFVVLALLFPFLALAIKLEDGGPIFYRQLRVGLQTSKSTRLIHITKFRTMRTDAEAKSGAVWASARDPRITRIGMFMRKTRLDELPQCLDVLRGDLSIVGPRPERPQFFAKLEKEIPFFIERTYGVKPGLTGLAQVELSYPETIEEVREKILHDHAYALRLASSDGWLATDLSIMARTFTVMLLGKGR